MAKVLTKIGPTNPRVAAAARALTSWLTLFEHTLNQRSKGRGTRKARQPAPLRRGFGERGLCTGCRRATGDSAASRDQPSNQTPTRGAPLLTLVRNLFDGGSQNRLLAVVGERRTPQSGTIHRLWVAKPLPCGACSAWEGCRRFGRGAV